MAGEKVKRQEITFGMIRFRLTEKQEKSLFRILRYRAGSSLLNFQLILIQNDLQPLFPVWITRPETEKPSSSAEKLLRR